LNLKSTLSFIIVAGMEPTIPPARILETCLCVTDLEAAERFYVGLLGLETFAKVPGRHVFFRVGDGMFLLFDATETAKPSITGLPTHGTVGPGHAAFAMPEGEIGAWRRRLSEHGVRLESDYTWPSGGRSLYFRDPSGNSIELATPKTWGLEA